MKKILFTLLLTLVGTASAWAEDMLNCVIMEFQNGEKLSIALKDNPKATFEEGDLVLVAENFEGRYATTDIKRFYFDEVAAGIKAIEAADKKSKGAIYDTAGRKVGTYEGNIDSNSLPFGTYVVKTESGKSFKVIKK